MRKGKGSNELLSTVFLGLLLVGLYFINTSKGKLNDPNGVLLGALSTKILFIFVGVIILLLVVNWMINRINRDRKRKKLRVSGIYQIDKMTGLEFENYLTVYFEDLNYRVEDVGGKGDKGADKILIEPGTGKRICVQAKCWDKNVTFDAVQQVFTAKTLWKCDEAWIITNRRFTKQVRETADELQIDLWDRERLIDNMYVYNKGKQRLAQEQGKLFLATTDSKVFHDLSCEHGRSLQNRQGILRFESYNQAVQSGRRKCNCYK